MSTYNVVHADCLTALRDMPDASVDAVVTDPPYGLSNTTPAQVTETITRWVSGDREYLPSARGFMGHEWDGFVPPVAVWDECLRVLKPGGHLLAFAGSRTHDLMTLGIRLAGFEIRDSVAWLYGSGFPKSMDVSKAIDKRGGNAHMAHEIGRAIKAARIRRGWTVRQADRHFCGGSTNWTWYEGRKGEVRPPSPADFERIVSEWPELAPLAESVAAAEREVVGRGQSGPASVAFTRDSGGTYDVTAAHSDAARQWEGWGTALKPAFEPVTLARKPLTGTVAANVQEHGTGALNIDACRIGTSDKLPAAGGAREMGNQVYGKGLGVSSGRSAELGGRWPANVVLDESQAEELDRQTGMLAGAGNKPGSMRTGRADGDAHERTSQVPTYSGGPSVVYNDKGGASRFFYIARKDNECPSGQSSSTVSTAEMSSSGEGQPPASAPNGAATSERHDTGKQTGSPSTSETQNGSKPNATTDTPTTPTIESVSSPERQHASTTLTRNPANSAEPNPQTDTMTTTTSHLKSAGSAESATSSTTQKSKGLGDMDLGDSSRFMYCAKAPKSERPVVDGVAHSTVKPVTLMKWLVRMVTPPGGTVLDPFAGSGTTLEAAMLEGFNAVGIEREADYLPLIQARIDRATAELAARAEAEGDTLFPIDGAAS